MNPGLVHATPRPTARIDRVPWAPGLLLALAIGIAAHFLARFTGAIPDVLLALLGGIAIANVCRLPPAVRPGVKFVLNKVLRAAIVLLGAGLTVAAIAGLGGATVGLVLVCVCIAMGLGLLLARAARLTGAIGTLIGAGTAICGGTAILAIGPLIGAADEEIAYAVTTIFTFNVIALLVYPPLGHALHLSSVAFGSWAGTAVNDTSVVVATGFVYDPTAGATATIVKLTRTLLLVPLAILTGWIAASRVPAGGVAQRLSPRRVLAIVPWFVLGFGALALLNSAGLIPPAAAHAMTALAGFLIVIVLAAVGLNVDLAKIARMGLRPLAVGMLLAVIMAVISLSLITALHIGSGHPLTAHSQQQSMVVF
jgi:uncharacterized integral membrane protein (TIGR00698 family)